MSIIKYQNLPTHDSGGNPTVVDVTGWGMTKVASYENFGDEMRDYLSTVKPKEGYAYLLVAAMGDQNWGPNRNGDYWPTEALKHAGPDYGHKTYEINGNWYHHHQNKDPNLSYGRVLKSVWNDDMGRIELIVEVDLDKDEKTREDLKNNRTIETSMGCFKAGTGILMASMTNKPIEEVRVGDEVIGHDGARHKVNNINDYLYRGDMCRILATSKDETFCTADHPFYAVTQDRLKPRERPSIEHASWVKAKDLKRNDYLMLPIVSEVNEPEYVNKYFAKLGHSESWIDDMYLYIRVKEVDIIPDQEVQVYNLDVEGSDSFIANLSAAHNSKVKYDICKICHPRWKEFYKIPEDEMIAISKATSLDVVHEIGRKHGVDLGYIKELNPDGGPVGIHSKTDKYCQHMKTQRNQVLPTGEQVCVVNLRPGFFDISRVTVNADKSSFVLAKVASEGGDDKEPPSEDIPDEAPDEKPKEEPKEKPDEKTEEKPEEKPDDKAPEPKKEDKKDNGITKEVPDGQVIADDFEDIKRYYTDHICPEMYRKEPEIPDKVMDSMAGKYDLPEILSSFLAMGMYPHPREFQRVVMIQMGKSDDLARADAEGDFLRHSDLPSVDFGQDLHEYPIGMGGDKVNPEIMDILKHFFWERSGHRRPVVKRMVIVKRAAMDNRYLQPGGPPPPQRSIIPGLAASLGTLYAISLMEGKKKIGNIGQDTQKLLQNKNLAATLGLGIAGAIILNSIIQKQMSGGQGKYAEDKYASPAAAAAAAAEKASPSAGAILAKLVGPTLGVYMLGGHIVNKARTGQPINKTEEFIAKHPMALSAAATVGVNRPDVIGRIPKALGTFGKVLMKGAEMGLDMSEINIDDYPLELRDIGGIAVWESIT